MYHIIGKHVFRVSGQVLPNTKRIIKQEEQEEGITGTDQLCR